MANFEKHMTRGDIWNMQELTHAFKGSNDDSSTEEDSDTSNKHAKLEEQIEKRSTLGSHDACHLLEQIFTCEDFDERWYEAAQEVIKNHRDAVRTYRDQANNNILHLLLTRFRPYWRLYRLDIMIPCVEQLLDLGVDTLELNMDQESALSMCLKLAAMNDDLHYLIRALDCARLIMTTWTGLQKRDATVLDHLYSLTSILNDKPSDEICLKWIGLYQYALDSKVLDVDFVVESRKTPWHYVLGGELLRLRKTPCMICNPLAKLCRTAIAQSPGDVEQFIPGAITTYPQQETRKTMLGKGAGGMIFTTVTDGAFTNDCCYIALLDVLLDSGAHVSNFMTLKPSYSPVVGMMKFTLEPDSQYYGHKWFVIATRPKTMRRPTLEQMFSFCKAIVKCSSFPQLSIQANMFYSLLHSADATDSAADVDELLARLEDMTTARMSTFTDTCACQDKTLHSAECAKSRNVRSG